MVTAGDICITAMTQSRPDQELLALEMFGFFARARFVPGTFRTCRDGLAMSVDGGKADLALGRIGSH